MSADAQLGGDRKCHYGADPVAHVHRIEAIDKKISDRNEQLALPTSLIGVKAMSRQEMDLEQAITHDVQKTKLTRCLMMEKSKSTPVDPKDPINHLDDIMNGILSRAPPSSTQIRRKKEQISKYNKVGLMDNMSDGNEVLSCTSNNSDSSDDGHFSSDIADVKTGSDSIYLGCKSPPHSRPDDMKLVAFIESPSKPNESSSATRSLQGHVAPIPADVIEKYRLTTSQIRELALFHDYTPGVSSPVGWPLYDLCRTFLHHLCYFSATIC